MSATFKTLILSLLITFTTIGISFAEILIKCEGDGSTVFTTIEDGIATEEIANAEFGYDTYSIGEDKQLNLIDTDSDFEESLQLHERLNFRLRDDSYYGSLTSVEDGFMITGSVIFTKENYHASFMSVVPTTKKPIFLYGTIPCRELKN